MSGDQLDLGASFDGAKPMKDTKESSRSTRTAQATISQLAPGTTIDAIYLLSAKEARTTKAGKPFFRLQLCDRTGSVDCMVWETEVMDPGVQAGDLVAVGARVSEYQGRRQ